MPTFHLGYEGFERFYDASLNRFLQPDSIVSNPLNPQTWNRYSYVSNRPINFNDPTGHMQESEQYADNDGVCEKGEGCVPKQPSRTECMIGCHSGSQGTGLPDKKSDDNSGEDDNNDKGSGDEIPQNTGPNSGYQYSTQTPPIPAGPVTLTFNAGISIYTNKPSQTIVYPNQLTIGPLTAGSSVNWRSDIEHRKFFGFGFDIANPGFTANAGYTLNLGKVNADLDIGVKAEFRKDLLIDSLETV